MEILRTDIDAANPVHQFESRGTASLLLGQGNGETRTWIVHLAAGGEIGRHEAGFDQLFIVAQGEGWAAGGDGRRVPIRVGEAARFAKGEMHGKGSETGMIAVMVQLEGLRAG